MTEATLDALWSKAVKLRTDYQCEWCPNPAVHAHHMERKRNALRWRLEGGVALCVQCHDRFHSNGEKIGIEKFRETRKDDWQLIQRLKRLIVPKRELDLDIIARPLLEIVEQAA